ncbi:DUF5958 family protein [Actinomadura sp. NPDC048032]|uniref:DUF5958 family protein n=1 Tax=Actinomadura sp. NPDC048032 TaxID=3155747 RepID=UPI0033F7C3F7
MNSNVILLNELSQGRRPLSEGIFWYRNLSVESQREVVRELAYYALQAGATTDDAQASIALAEVKPTATPAVLVSRGEIRQQLAKVGNLPASEMETSFRLLLAILSVADTRRRKVQCAQGCSHFWHNWNDDR